MKRLLIIVFIMLNLSYAGIEYIEHEIDGWTCIDGYSYHIIKTPYNSYTVSYLPVLIDSKHLRCMYNYTTKRFEMLK